MTPIERYVTKLLGYRRESKAPNRTLGFPISFKIIIKIIIQGKLNAKISYRISLPPMKMKVITLL